MPKYAAYLLHEDSSETDRSDTDSPLIAIAAYRHLVARADLRHVKPCAVLEADGREIASVLVDGRASAASIDVPAEEFPPQTRASVAQRYTALLQQPLPDSHTSPRDCWVHAKVQFAATDAELLAAIRRAGWALSKNRLNSWRRSDAGGRIASEMNWGELAALLDAIRIGGLARR